VNKSNRRALFVRDQGHCGPVAVCESPRVSQMSLGASSKRPAISPSPLRPR
jgi:hypothetical protein